MNSCKLWIHMIFSYMNSYVSWIHIWIRVCQGSRCSKTKQLVLKREKQIRVCVPGPVRSQVIAWQWAPSELVDHYRLAPQQKARASGHLLSSPVQRSDCPLGPLSPIQRAHHTWAAWWHSTGSSTHATETLLWISHCDGAFARLPYSLAARLWCSCHVCASRFDAKGAGTCRRYVEEEGAALHEWSSCRVALVEWASCEL